MRAFTHEVSQVDIILFSKLHFLVRDDKNVIVQVFAGFWKYQGLFGLVMGILARHTVSPKYKPWLDQTRPDIFPNRAKTCPITYKNWTASSNYNRNRFLAGNQLFEFDLGGLPLPLFLLW